MADVPGDEQRHHRPHGVRLARGETRQLPEQHRLQQANRSRDQASLYLRAGTIVGLVASVLVAFPTGDAQAKTVAKHQEVVLAAMEISPRFWWAGAGAVMALVLAAIVRLGPALLLALRDVKPMTRRWAWRSITSINGARIVSERSTRVCATSRPPPAPCIVPSLTV